MPRWKGKHLAKENGEVIEKGVRDLDSARSIARAIGVSPPTVSREVRAHRTVRDVGFPKSGSGASRCALYCDCQRGAAPAPSAPRG